MASTTALAAGADCCGETTSAKTSGIAAPTTAYKRRHSSFRSGKLSISSLDWEDGLQLKIDNFLEELERRLDIIEEYGDIDLDASIQRAYATLQAVRARCSQVSEEVLDAGRRRAKVMVETLEGRYQDALVAKETLAEKAQTGLILLEEMLCEYEARAAKFQEQGFRNAANTVIEGGRRIVDEGISRAKVAVDDSIERTMKAAEALDLRIAHAVSEAKRNGLIKFQDLPAPWQVNPHITSGYRFSESKVHILRSTLTISNELVNIWSHAIGLLIVLSIAFYFYPTSVNFSLSTKADKVIAAVFFFAACKCLVCSCLWHTMNCVANRTLLERFACVDYTGISLLIAASIMTTEYTAFYCEPVARNSYLIATATLGVAGVILPWHPTFNGKNMAWGRVAFYVTLAATGFVPVVQLVKSRGGDWAWDFYAPITKSIAVYFCGAIVYASKVPEKWYPGAFDYVGGSHNLWHFAVLGGILFHYRAMEHLFAAAFERAQLGCPTS
ncbi:hypothetical protein V495_05624 [Pseudogymnoascus sp. VKM F-4514 (FW-929)]|nr:hypothetical protein V495_05624 [Pseudogymnoascus sp. VKM F-4514 (FW-929)]KFY57080.1 hypothetical protein V497_05758 [Pseudogymnoascus sp. VKM F-4516 (FW-969)]